MEDEKNKIKMIIRTKTCCRSFLSFTSGKTYSIPPPWRFRDGSTVSERAPLTVTMRRERQETDKNKQRQKKRREGETYRKKAKWRWKEKEGAKRKHATRSTVASFRLCFTSEEEKAKHSFRSACARSVSTSLSASGREVCEKRPVHRAWENGGCVKLRKRVNRAPAYEKGEKWVALLHVIHVRRLFFFSSTLYRPLPHPLSWNIFWMMPSGKGNKKKYSSLFLQGFVFSFRSSFPFSLSFLLQRKN